MSWRVGVSEVHSFRMPAAPRRNAWALASVVVLCLFGCSRESSYKTRRLEPRAVGASQDTTAFVPPFVRESLPSSAAELVKA